MFVFQGNAISKIMSTDSTAHENTQFICNLSLYVDSDCIPIKKIIFNIRSRSNIAKKECVLASVLTDTLNWAIMSYQLKQNYSNFCLMKISLSRRILLGGRHLVVYLEKANSSDHFAKYSSFMGHKETNCQIL